MNTDTTVKMLLTQEEAIKEVKRRVAGRSNLYFIRVQWDLPTVDENGKPNDRQFSGVPMGSIEVSQATAIDYLIKLTIRGLEERGARIPVSRSEWDMVTKNRSAIHIG